MKESNLQFKHPHLTMLDFEINNDFDKDDLITDLPIAYEMSVNTLDEENHAIVVLKLKIGGSDDESKKVQFPFFIEASIAAEFISQDGSKINESLLRINGAVALLSYLRPIISFITSNSPFSALDLPFLDFTDELAVAEFEQQAIDDKIK